MTDFLLYDAKVAAALLVFYLCYRFLLSKETFHRFNRAVLVGTAGLSFLLPLCVITIRRPVVILPAAAESTVLSGLPLPEAQAPVESALPWWPAALTVLFWAGVVFVLARVLVSVLSLLRIIRRSEAVREEDGCRILVTARDIDPFSWMRFIVLSRQDWEQPHASILAHEKAHVACRHSLEILLVDLLSALQWFNPAIWMLRADLRELHEYEADDAVLRSGTDIREYQYLLIRKAVGKSGYSVANSFNHSILKNRITMMSKSRSPLSRGWRVLWLLPLVCLGLGLQARTIYVPKDKDSDNNAVRTIPDEKLPDTVVLHVRTDGTIESDGREIALQDLAGHIRSLNLPFPGTTVQINADADTPMGHIDDVKNELRKINALRVNYGAPSEASAVTRHLTPSLDKKVNVMTYDEALAGYNREDICVSRINSNDRIFFKDQAVRDDAEILRIGKDFLREHGIQTLFSLGCERGTSYAAYQHMQALLVQVYSDVRDEQAREIYGKSLSDLSQEERDAVLRRIPMRIVEPEMQGR
ncbi:MAG: M56 family metallopeptidase [Bacteroidales bacterium]|nr:M56 family metallopeptidase [Bacteroidales bacterium]